MSEELQREYLIRLPLPLAQLYSRIYNAKDARGRHDNAFYLLEALVKLCASTLASAYLARSKRVPTLDRMLAGLALPSLGQWMGLVRELARHFGEGADASSHPMGAMWKELDTAHRDRPGMLALYQRIKNGPDGQPSNAKHCSLLQVLESIVQYRNAVFGHGAGREESFYESEMGPLLLPAVNEILAEGTLGILGPKGSRLAYLTEMRILDDGRVQLGLRELVGREGITMSPRIVEQAKAAELGPHRVGLLWPGRETPLLLDPLLVYRETELAEEILFLNRDRSGRQVEYLSYATGRTERDATMAPAMAKLLSRVTGREVGTAEVAQFAESTLAESPSVEDLFAAQTGEGEATRVGEFDLVAELGRGGMGVVYLAKQLSLGRHVALKMLPAELAADEVALARFKREIRSLGRCEHPNIVKILSSGTLPDGELYYTMEYVPGADLEHVFQELGQHTERDGSSLGSGALSKAVITASRKTREQSRRKDREREGVFDSLLPLPPTSVPIPQDEPGEYVRRVVTLIRDVASALQVVHDRDFVHRDVKPANLMLTADGTRIVLMDFGLAKGRDVSVALTRAGGFLGTLRYAAPEQLAASTLKVGPRADVRALGVILWELLTRRRAFGDAEDESQLAAWVLSRDLPRIRSIDKSLSADLDEIVAQATARDANDRTATARQLAEYLDLFLQGAPLPIRPPRLSELLRRWVRKNRALVATLSLVFGALVVTIVVAFILVTRSRDTAIAAKQRADDRALTTRRYLYAAQMHKAFDEAWYGHVDRAVELLDDQTPKGGDVDLRSFEWYLLERLCSRNQPLRADSPVYSLAFSADGKTMATGDARGAITVWDPAARARRTKLDAHSSTIWSLAFSRDGALLATASEDRTIRFWDTSSWARVASFVADSAFAAYSVSFSADGKTLASGGRDWAVKRWAVPTGKAREPLVGHKGSIASVAYSPDGRMIASASEDGAIRLWDAMTAAAIPPPLEDRSADGGDADKIEYIAFSPDGKVVATGGEAAVVTLWDVERHTVVRKIPGHEDKIMCVAFSPDGKRVASASTDTTARVWDAASGALVHELRGHAAVVNIVAFSPDGSTIATAGADQSIELWNAADGRRTSTVTKATAASGVLQAQRIIATDQDDILALAFARGGKLLASAGADRTVKLYDTDGGKELLPRLETHEHDVRAIAFSPDGKQLAAVDDSGALVLSDVDSRRGEKPVRIGPTAARSVSYSPDGRSIAVAQDRNVHVVDVATSRPRTMLLGHQDIVRAVAYSPSGDLLASAGKDAVVRIWDVTTNKEVKSLAGHVDQIMALAWSADGKTVASASMDTTAKIWDPYEGKLLFTLEGHTQGIPAIAFSPDKKTLATGSRDKTVKLWDPFIGREKAALSGHTRQVNAIAFTPNGRVLASGDDNGLVHIWDGSARD